LISILNCLKSYISKKQVEKVVKENGNQTNESQNNEEGVNWLESIQLWILSIRLEFDWRCYFNINS
jgi:hypothetical protein